MTHNVITITEDQNISAASRKMYENKIGSIIVVGNEKDQNAVGILTERDIVRILGQLEPWLMSTSLRILMSKPLITIASNSSVRDAIQTMYSKKMRRLPVVSEKDTTNHLIGIITDKDIFKVLMKNQNLVQSVLSDDFMAQHMQTVQEQFAEYWFGNILVHKK